VNLWKILHDHTECVKTKQQNSQRSRGVEGEHAWDNHVVDSARQLARRRRGIAEVCHKTASRAWRVLRRALAEAAADRITTSAASLAFHWFLALFPAALALVGLAHVVGLSGEALTQVVNDVDAILPAQAASVIDQALATKDSAHTGTLELIVGSGAALWGAVEAMASLQVGLDVAFEVRRDRGFIRRRLVALPLVALTVAFGGAAFAMVVLGVPIGRLLEGSVPIVGPVFAWLWGWVRWLGAAVLVVILLSCYYSLGPARSEKRWRLISPGSAAATVAWFVASAAFSYYLNHYGHETRSYGAFAGVASLMLWLLVAAVSVLAGAEIDCELQRADGPRAG